MSMFMFMSRLTRRESTVYYLDESLVLQQELHIIKILSVNSYCRDP